MSHRHTRWTSIRARRKSWARKAKAATGEDYSTISAARKAYRAAGKRSVSPAPRGTP